MIIIKSDKELEILRVETNAVVCVVEPCQEHKTSGTDFRRLKFPPNRIPQLAPLPPAAAVPAWSGGHIPGIHILTQMQHVLIIEGNAT